VKDFDEPTETFRRPQVGAFRVDGREYHHRAGVRAEALGKILDANVLETMQEIAACDEWILACLVNEDRERWTEARTWEDSPIGLGDLRQIAWWLVEVMMGRPTGSLSVSGSGQTGTSTTSTEPSPSPVAA
jgi:hypothetical protein